MKFLKLLIAATIAIAVGLLVGILFQPQKAIADEEIIHTSKYWWEEAHRLNQEEWRAWQKQNYYYEQEKAQEEVVVEPTPTPQPVQHTPSQTADLDKLAYAVAMAETANCTKGHGAEYNNCFGIRNGNTAPCEKIGRSRMCIYNSPEESYEAFKNIRSKAYGGVVPQRRHANTRTGGDRVETWLENVLHYYHN